MIQNPQRNLVRSTFIATLMQEENTKSNGTTIQGLLDNDHVSNAPNALINVTGVSNASHGEVSFNAATGNMTFTPDAGFSGTATANHYKNRSCLRKYLLGCSTRTHLKTAQNCARPASVTAKKRKEAQKLVDLGKKNDQNCLFMCTSSH